MNSSIYTACFSSEMMESGKDWWVPRAVKKESVGVAERFLKWVSQKTCAGRECSIIPIFTVKSTAS